MTLNDLKLAQGAAESLILDAIYDTQLSYFVRLVDMLSELNNASVFTNRGASGIDGIVATAAGVQRAQKRPLVLYIGDTSLLYDISSLALFTHTTTPTVIVVTNNDGGAIFDLLPVPGQQKEALYQMPHGYHFEFAARQFGLHYQKPQSMVEFQATVLKHLTVGEGAFVIEVQTPPTQASTQLKQFIQKVHAL